MIFFLFVQTSTLVIDRRLLYFELIQDVNIHLFNKRFLQIQPPLLFLHISKFLRVVYSGKVALAWPLFLPVCIACLSMSSFGQLTF